MDSSPDSVVALGQQLTEQGGFVADGRWSARQDALPSPRLRRENRIQTIQASLAIERNSLSLEQVTALFDGQRVLGPARDIQEVRNAIAAYDTLPRWDPANREHLLADPMALITEDHLEQQCLEWFQELGYTYAFAPDLAPDGTTPERTVFWQVILTGRLRSAIQRLNPGVPAGTIESAVMQLANPDVPAPLALHRWMGPRQSCWQTPIGRRQPSPGPLFWPNPALRAKPTRAW